MFLRSPHKLWKTLDWLLPGLNFIPNTFSPAGVAKERPLLILRNRYQRGPITPNRLLDLSIEVAKPFVSPSPS